MPRDLPDGLYDLLLTESLVLPADASHSVITPLAESGRERLAEVLGDQLSKILAELGADDDQLAIRQLELVNGLLVDLRNRLTQDRATQESAEIIDLIANPARVLSSVSRAQATAIAPETGLSVPWLFTAGKGSPSLLQEIRRELYACDQVDILVSFITISGVRKLRDVFQGVTSAGGGGETKAKIRVLTTTYMGHTEIEAIDELARLPGCEVRISLDGRRTRLHAKAWIFQRQTGFGTAYVGSANLSGAALTGGLEWTVKFTQRSQQALYMRAIAHFETLWSDSEFQHYDPRKPGHRKALIEALGREAGDQPSGRIGFFDLQPKTYQQEMLDTLANERLHGRRRNLIVAATGTGKTVVAAFDYRATCESIGGRPRLLFVAHREEILRQAMRTYREVLRDQSFGQILAGGQELTHHEHLFATIDSAMSRNLVARFGPDYWHSVVIDECHRLAADRFHTFVTSVRPTLMLGLTATPERSDGVPIATYFDVRSDGSPAVELRLWDALDLQLLAPFEYFACDDDTDFSGVPWNRVGERDAIDSLVSANDVRARLVINEWQRLCVNPRRARALVFCVSVAHAKFMTGYLNKSGLPALCVVGETAAEDRRVAPQRLASGDICALVTVDLYNEGVDLPNVDTLLLLRPTQSAVLFQQQIGRGLRLSTGKETCLILDFVGQHRADFRFDQLLSTLTGLSRRELLEGVERGFDYLPSGCHLQLQHKTREQVLRNLRAFTQQNWRRLISELQSHAALAGRDAVRLSTFLRDQALNLTDIYRSTGSSGWACLKRASGLTTGPAPSEEAYFGRRLGDLLHLDDIEQLDVIRRVSDARGVYTAKTSTEETRLQMLAYQVDGQRNQVGSYRSFLHRLVACPEVCDELGEISDILQRKTSLLPRPVPGLADVPLCLHGGYRIREILTAVGWLMADRRIPFQAGTLSLKERRTELLFVTLDKSTGYHDGIAYNDYAISRDRFHWQSQNSAGPDTPAGIRYLLSSENGWTFQLFVRGKKDLPYRVCGPVVLESADGDRPMNIVWQLKESLPARLFQEFSVLRGI